MKPLEQRQARFVILLTAILVSLSASTAFALEMVRIAVLDRRLRGNFPCGDADNNGRYELYGSSFDTIFAFEHVSEDDYRRINLGPGARGVGVAGVWALGDGDGDGSTELIAELMDGHSDRIIESPNHWSFPRDSVWQVSEREHFYGWPRFTDLNRNGRSELAINEAYYGIWLFENVGNNRYESVAVLNNYPPYTGSYTSFDTGDLDRDGRCELVTGDVGGRDNAPVWFFSSTGRPDSPYVVSAVCSTRINQIGCVAAAPDMDRDGWPEIIVLGFSPESTVMMVYQATGPAHYERVWAQLVSRQGWFNNLSVGDIDGDGIDEFAWGSAGVYLFKCAGLRQYEQVWQSNSGGGIVRLFDINRDGRAEVIFNVGEHCEIWGDTEGLALNETWKRPRSMMTAIVQPTIARMEVPVWFGSLPYGADLEIVNSCGRPVRKGRATENTVWQWDLRDESGLPVPVGTYYCVVRTRNQSTSLKLCVVK